MIVLLLTWISLPSRWYILCLINASLIFVYTFHFHYIIESWSFSESYFCRSSWFQILFFSVVCAQVLNTCCELLVKLSQDPYLNLTLLSQQLMLQLIFLINCTGTSVRFVFFKGVRLWTCVGKQIDFCSVPVLLFNNSIDVWNPLCRRML